MNIYTLNKIDIWTHQENEVILEVKSSEGKVREHINVKLYTDVFPGQDCIKTKTSSLNIPPLQKNKHPILPFVSSELHIFKSKIKYSMG